MFERGVPFDASINLSICLKNPSVLRNLSSDLGDMELKKPLPSCVTSLIPRDVWFNRMKVKSSTQLPNRHLILHSKQASGRSPQTASLNRNSTSEMERWITSWCKILQNYPNLPNKKHGILQKPIPFLPIFFLIGVYFFWNPNFVFLAHQTCHRALLAMIHRRPIWWTGWSCKDLCLKVKTSLLIEALPRNR